MKVCTKCQQLKDLNEFNIRKEIQSGYTSHCKECKKQYRKINRFKINIQQNKWRLKNRDEDLLKKKNYYQENREQKRKNDLLKKFNLTLEDYNNLLIKQNYCCAICGNKETAKAHNGNIKFLAVDHCHKTNKVRGLLCMFCNTGLGKFKDNIEYLQKAVNYLWSNN